MEGNLDNVGQMLSRKVSSACFSGVKGLVAFTRIYRCRIMLLVLHLVAKSLGALDNDSSHLPTMPHRPTIDDMMASSDRPRQTRPTSIVMGVSTVLR